MVLTISSVVGLVSLDMMVSEADKFLPHNKSQLEPWANPIFHFWADLIFFVELIDF